MRELTQTNLEPGNCWQTAFACILDIDPELLPDQVAVESGQSKASYYNALQAYLREHHGLAFVNIAGPVIRAVKVKGLHVICGPTVRSADHAGRHHCVVGRDGVAIWDPHPSRAGLLNDEAWNILLPYPEEWRRPDINESQPCICPRCKP